MIKYNYILFTTFSFITVIINHSLADDTSNGLVDLQGTEKEINFAEDDIQRLFYENEIEKVNVKLYYESRCPYCILFITKQLSAVVKKLYQYTDIQTYPYGNAQTFNLNGRTVFKCQHGPVECYGNKLHACALDLVTNNKQALLFNTCMMDFPKNQSSNDEAADKCAKSMSLDSELIKACAKGERGTELLKYYGEESKKANFSYVPYILINGEVNDGNSFFKDICKKFSVPPPPCVNYRHHHRPTDVIV